MFEEPYRWIESINNRREYLNEQLKEGGPVVALPCREGILLVTISAGTQKLYEIYDRIALGAMGHPADVERLRDLLLDAAHLEGFNRSPSDVTARRLVQFGLAPLVKQAFEEVGRGPFTIRLLLAELGPDQRRTFLSLNYDGLFKEEPGGALLAPSAQSAERMRRQMEMTADYSGRPIEEVFPEALRIWAAGEGPGENLDHRLREVLQERSAEVLLLSHAFSGSSKVRALPDSQIRPWLHRWRSS